jgi:ribosomal protein S25
VTTCDCEQGGASAKDRINTLIAATNKHVAHAKALLQAMRDETAAMKKDPKKGSSANTRVRENLLNTFTRKFVDVAKEYQVTSFVSVFLTAVQCRHAIAICLRALKVCSELSNSI